MYGFEDMLVNVEEVEKALSKVRHIREAISELASIEQKALLQSFGLEEETYSLSEESSEESAADDVEEGRCASEPRVVDITEDVKIMLRRCNFNWFEFTESLQSQQQELSSIQAQLMLESFSKRGFDEREMRLLRQSNLAFCAAEGDAYDEDRIARAVNGEIVSASESDSLEAYTNVTELLSTAGKAKKRMKIKRRARRRREKAIAEQRFLSRKVSKRANQIFQMFPDIGETIETVEHRVGADAWRRTGVLTFDGNTKLKQKVTYEKHLEEVYSHKFSYATVFQLCVPRNRRRRSAKRYMGIAKVTSRRARKGFNLRLNPDAHWSAALHKGWSQLEHVDGRDMLNMNRDDSTGFRLDTLTTCAQYATPGVQGQEVLTTRTDYVNKHPSVLQTTPYNFSKTSTTGEVCVGVVKASPLHQKNPA